MTLLADCDQQKGVGGEESAGFEVPIYPLALGIGIIILLLSGKENYLKQISSKISFDATSMILFCCLALSTVVVSFLGLFLASEMGHLEIRATPFTWAVCSFI